MANYKKSLNLRNGVQVDDDNFIVNTNGLVGIGTSVPTEFLDVRGNAKVVGLVTANTLYAGIATVGFLKATGASLSGVMTAASFSGSASGLTGIYAIAVDGWYVTSGSISTTSNVGVATTNPQGNLQVGTGVTINSNGNATYSGVVTAVNFDGSGANITSINASNISSGTLSNSRLPSSINVSGVVTATSGFVGNVTGIASTALSLSGNPSISVTNVTASGTISGPTATITAVNSGFSTSGITTVYTLLNIANSASIGLGTTNPNANIHIRDANDGASLQLTSDGSNEAYVSIGRSVTRSGNNGELRFGNPNTSYLYSTSSSLDVINYGIGNINNYLQLGSSGVGTGSFNWIYGQSYNTPIMSLTYGGRLGIGITNPINTLHVVGTSTVTSDTFIGGNAGIVGNLNVGGSLVANNFVANTMTGSFVGSLSGNVNSTGVSTFNNINSSGITTLASVNSTRIGVGTTASLTYPLQVNSLGQSFVVNSLGGIGVCTDKFAYANNLTYNVTVDASQGVGYFQGVGVGTTTPSCFADFSAAGYNVPNLGSIYQYMLPPKITTTTRNSLSVVEGALIYNVTSKRLELYNGNGWCGIATIA